MLVLNFPISDLLLLKSDNMKLLWHFYYYRVNAPAIPFYDLSGKLQVESSRVTSGVSRT